mmetsp:Transcript_11828/g.16906  ORF Transcript_11828/g.16906 Transcript_11828/m.16906 type:complete len:235 (+) Transcript_11828:3-707(+)
MVLKRVLTREAIHCWRLAKSGAQIVPVSGVCLGSVSLAHKPRVRDTVGFCYVTPYYPSTLQQRLHNPNPEEQTLSSAMRILIAWDVTSALCSLHACGVVHGNLTPDHILLDDSDRAWVSDVWHSGRDKALSTISKPAKGPRVALAPEQCYTVGGERGESCQTDIWALGCVLAELFLGRRPPTTTTSSSGSALGSKNLDTPDVATLIKACLADNPSARPSSVQVRAMLSNLGWEP